MKIIDTINGIRTMDIDVSADTKIKVLTVKVFELEKDLSVQVMINLKLSKQIEDLMNRVSCLEKEDDNLNTESDRLYYKSRDNSESIEDVNFSIEGIHRAFEHFKDLHDCLKETVDRLIEEVG